MNFDLSSIAAAGMQRSPEADGQKAPEEETPKRFEITPEMEKDIIAYCKNQFESYHRSQIFQNWRSNSEAIVDAVEQRYRVNEQVTRSGFYLAALRAEFDGLREGATNIFSKANPIFIFRKKPGFDQGVADKVQQHVNDEWDRMNGLEKFSEILDDVWQYGCGMSYTKWDTKTGYGQFPVLAPQAWGRMLDWQEGFQTLSSGPDIERIHPLNWAGDFQRNRDLAWEGCMREWKICDVQKMVGDSRYLQPAVQKTLVTMKEGKSGYDPYYFHPYDQTGGMPYKASARAIGYEYWGDLNGVKGFEDDPHEYVVVWSEDQLLRFNYNPIFIGGEHFRPFVRTRSNKMNNFPMGRSILGPNLTHQKLLNLMTNLGVDDILIRQHLGIAVWNDSVENVNDLTNPEGARGFVWMKNGANQNQVPRMIADNKSGILNDSMEFMDRFIKPDMQKSGINDLSLGLKEGAANGTATAANLLASTANRRTQAAVINVCKTGLMPIARQATLLILRNRPMDDLKQFSSEEIVRILSNNDWDMHDSILQDPYQDAMNKAEFFNMFKDVALQIAGANGDASHIIEMGRDIARDKGIKPDDFDRYFPRLKPPQVSTGLPGVGAPPNPGSPSAPMPGISPAAPSPADSAMVPEEVLSA